MKKTLLTLFVTSWFLIGLSACLLQEHRDEVPVKVVKDFFELCNDGNLNEAQKLTSKMIRINENKTQEIYAEIQGKEFDFTQIKAVSEQKFKVEKVLETKVEKYRAKILILARNEAGSNKFGVCLSRDIETNDWKINYNRLYLDDWDYESSRDFDMPCVKP